MFEKGAMVFMHPLFLRGIAQEGLRHIKRRPASGALGGVTVNAPPSGTAPGMPPHLMHLHAAGVAPGTPSTSDSSNPPGGAVWLPPRLPGSGTLSSISLGSGESRTHSLSERDGATPIVDVADAAGRLNMRPASPAQVPTPAGGGTEARRGGGRLAPWGVGITGLQAQAIQGIPHAAGSTAAAAGSAGSNGNVPSGHHPLAPLYNMVDSLDGQAMTLPLRRSGSRAASEATEEDSIGNSTPTSAGLGAPFIPGGGGPQRVNSISSHSLGSASGASRPATPSAKWADALGLPSGGMGHGLAAQLLAPGGSLARALDAADSGSNTHEGDDTVTSFSQLPPAASSNKHSTAGGGRGGGKVGGAKRGAGGRTASVGGKKPRRGGKRGTPEDPGASMRQTAEAVAAGEALVTAMEHGNEQIALTVMGLWQRVNEMQTGVVAAQALVQRLLRGSSDAVGDEALQEKLSSLG